MPSLSRFLLGKPNAAAQFHTDLINATDNFRNVSWLGVPIWQNVLDLWVVQEVISTIKPALLVETGTNRGGSSLFYAHLMDLLGYDGQVVTVDVEKMHDLSHPRVTYLIGSSVDRKISDQIHGRAAKVDGPIMVILDSDHSTKHVLAELEIYAPLVTLGSYCQVQDGVVDTLPFFTDSQKWTSGPRKAILRYLQQHKDEFAVDRALCSKFLITHHPDGWLKRHTVKPGCQWHS
jgi:cephalosporin hydroxylase